MDTSPPEEESPTTEDRTYSSLLSTEEHKSMIFAGDGIRMSCKCGWRGEELSYTTDIETLNRMWHDHLLTMRVESL
jgi:hypothetical protein